MSRSVRLAIRLAACLAVLLPVHRAAAQRSVREEARRSTATREELENRAIEDEQLAAQPGTPEKLRREKLADAAALRERLRSGDFQVGDRVVLRLSGDPTLPPVDTVSVRAGGVIVIDRLGEVNVRGVLRSELAAHMRKEVSRFVRGATVQATSVVRLGVFGAVGRPGFFELPSEALLSEVLMKAGLAQDADQHNVSVNRGGNEIWQRQAVDVAMQEGISIDQLGLRGGDQIMIGQKRDMSAQVVLQYFMIGFQIINMALIISTRSR